APLYSEEQINPWINFQPLGWISFAPLVTRTKPDRFAQHQMHLLDAESDMHKGLTYDYLHH
ncbi:hypothetical protein CJS38_16535, partial [Salmonella enterica subsp. enterica serovar Schwarzengrund]